jgi:hypothetical protein
MNTRFPFQPLILLSGTLPKDPDERQQAILHLGLYNLAYPLVSENVELFNLAVSYICAGFGCCDSARQT